MLFHRVMMFVLIVVVVISIAELWLSGASSSLRLALIVLGASIGLATFYRLERCRWKLAVVDRVFAWAAGCVIAAFAVSVAMLYFVHGAAHLAALVVVAGGAIASGLIAWRRVPKLVRR